MIMKVVCYKDVKMNIYAQPIFMQGELTNDDLVECFRRMCASPEMPKAYFNYDVYLLGEYDDKLGIFKSHEPEYLCSLGDYRHLAEVEEQENA